MIGKESRKNDNHNADDSPEYMGAVPLILTLAPTLPQAARNLLFRNRQKSALVAEL
jgi:hypothetical protein